MSRRCTQCDRGSTRDASRSHSKIRTLKRQYVNIQKVAGEKVCTRCIRTSIKNAK